MAHEIIIGLITGIISGLITGLITGVLVTKYFNKKQQNLEIYEFWLRYIADAFDKSSMHLPADTLSYLGPLGGLDSEFGKAVFNIENIIYPFDGQAEITDEEDELSENAVKALNELTKWAKEKGITGK